MDTTLKLLCNMVVVVVVLLLELFLVTGQDLNATRLTKFVDELPLMRTIYAFRSEQGRMKSINLTIGMFQTRWKFHRDLPETTVFAYGTSFENASVPGPTIEARPGVPVQIQWQNWLPSRHILPGDKTISTATPPHDGVPTVVHLHGGMNQPDSDGHAQAWFTAGFRDRGPKWSRASYYYHNAQGAGNLWYHDHAMGLTRTNILAGLSGAYIIRDPQLDRRLNLPCGDAFDRVLMISDRDFNRDGSIYMNPRGNNPRIHPQWQPEYFGSVIIVNGKAWPYLRVQRRSYRFRIINTSNARFYQLGLVTAVSKSSLKFSQVGSDAFYLPETVTVTSITIAPAEIHDVVVDFSNTKEDVFLTNTAPYPFPAGDPVDFNNGVVMKFAVESRGRGMSATGSVDPLPSSLVPIQRLFSRLAVQTRSINLYEFVSSTDEPTHLYINAVPFDAPVTETPRSGSTELWHVINLTEDNHPMHIHLAAFQVAGEVKLKNVSEFRGCLLKNKNQMSGRCSFHRFIEDRRWWRWSKPPRNEAGWKNIYKMKPGHLTSILVRFAAVDGTPYPFDATAEPGYAYHCHILDHEDNEMMRPLKLVR